MITAKEAIKAAMQFVMEMFSDEKIMDMRLEEVERDSRRPYWRVTLSFVRGNAPGAIGAVLHGGSQGRDYKTLAVDVKTGNVEWMRIRQLA